MIKRFCLLGFLFLLVSCHQYKPDFKLYAESLSKIKTPLIFSDAKTLETLVGPHDLAYDTLFFSQGYTPVGKIQATPETITLLLLESGFKNNIHIKTFDYKGNQLETFLLDTNYGQLNDSTFRGGNYTLRDSIVLIQFDSIKEITHYDGSEITTSRWNKDTIVIYPNSRLKK